MKALFAIAGQTETQAQNKNSNRSLSKRVSSIDTTVATCIPVTVNREQFAEIINDWTTVFIPCEVANMQAIRDFMTEMRSFRFTTYADLEGLVDWFNYDTDYNADIELLHDYAEKIREYKDYRANSSEAVPSFEKWKFKGAEKYITKCCRQLKEKFSDKKMSIPVDYKCSRDHTVFVVHFINDEWWRFSGDSVIQVRENGSGGFVEVKE